MRTIKTGDGFTLRIFSSGYLDWGLEIFAPNNESVYYNPHCIASDCVGFHHEDEEGNELEEGIPWSDKDWYACDCCDERLGGQRYDIVGLNPGEEPDDWYELSVCVDCYCDLVG